MIFSTTNWYQFSLHKYHTEQYEEAVAVIQRCWRKYRVFSLLPKALKYRRNKACWTIQKFARGYQAYHKVKNELRETRLRAWFNYFDDMRQKLCDQNVRVIQYHSRKFLQKLHEKQESELKIKEKSKTKFNKTNKVWYTLILECILFLTL